MIYFDSAATTLQKPPSVAAAAARAMGQLSSPGRGGYSTAESAAEMAFRCRSAAAALFDVPSPEQVVFTFNATHALNIAIRSQVKPGSRVITSGYEHNAVTRTLGAIPQVTVTAIDTPLFQPELFLTRAEELLHQGADVVVCCHVSNVFGYALPIDALSQLCQQWNVPLIVDASQSAGILPISMTRLSADFIAMPGHKGLYGPQGTGLLLCGTEQVIPLLTGGTGSNSLDTAMPKYLPDRLEAGTHNMPGIAGLLEGLRFVEKLGIARIRTHENQLCQKAAEGLSRLPNLQVFYSPSNQVGVLSLRSAGVDCETLAGALGMRGIAVRAGLHCAPLAHRTAGTAETGTVRLSFSAFNTEEEVNTFLRMFPSILAGEK